MSDVFILKETVSIDGGRTFIDTEDHLLFGYYFFAYENRNVYTREVYTIIDILSEIGGLSTSVIAGIGLIGNLINTNYFQMHFVDLLYFDVRTHKSSKKYGSQTTT